MRQRPPGLLPAALGALLLTACGGERVSDRIELVYESPAILCSPECVLFDPARDCYYISNLNERGAQNRDGFISRFTLEDRALELEWLRPLEDPRGLALRGDDLIIADRDTLLVYSLEDQQFRSPVEIPGAGSLNDVATDGQRLFVSDFRGDAIFVVEEGSVTKLGVEVKAPNGLAWRDDTLFVGTFGPGPRLISVSLADLSTRVLRDEHGESIDGLAVLAGGTFLTSNFTDRLQLQGGGSTIDLLRSGGTNVCDFSYDESRSLIAYASMNGSSLRILRLSDQASTPQAPSPEHGGR